MNAPRYHHLDALRAVAMLLGIVLHAAMSFLFLGSVDLELPWPAADRSRSIVLTVFVAGVHAFRMQTFFLMAGFFAHMLLDRRGVAGFLRHRAKRILVPLLVGTVVLVPLIQVLFCVGFSGPQRTAYFELGRQVMDLTEYDRGVREFFAGGYFITQFNWAHLWFLMYLLVLYGLFLVTLPLSQRLLARRWVTATFCYVAGSYFKPLLMAVPTFLLMLPMVEWGADTPVVAYPETRIVAYYALFFGFGWLLYQHAGLIEACGKYWRTYLALGILLAFPLYLQLVQRGLAGGVYHPAYRLPALACYALATWLMVFGVIGLFIRYFSRPSRPMRYVSDSAYWLYLAHLPLVIALQLLVQDWPGGAWLKFLLINVVSLTVLLVSYEYCVRYTFIGAVLNGRKYRTPSDGQAEIGREKLPGELADER